jgi:pSer/pThr/pTyr-binding forkhead associated (FHA) protein
MAKLVLTLGGKVINQYFIDKPNITIGRDAGNDLVIEDQHLSRVHLSIVKLGNDAIIEDLQSSNGSRINGKPLARQILQHLDIIELGRHQIRYMSSGIAAEADFDRTMLIRTSPRPVEEGAGAAVIDVPLAQAAKTPRLAEGSVDVMAAPLPHTAGQKIQLDRVVTTFGVPGDALIVLTRRPQGVFLAHVEGAKLPRVNQQSIGDASYPLKAGDLIEAAGYQLKFNPGV